MAAAAEEAGAKIDSLATLLAEEAEREAKLTEATHDGEIAVQCRGGYLP
jgi:hypothetical protein